MHTCTMEKQAAYLGRLACGSLTIGAVFPCAHMIVYIPIGDQASSLGRAAWAAPSSVYECEYIHLVGMRS